VLVIERESSQGQGIHRQEQRFFLANGFSGHGVMHAPTTGKILSDLILHAKTDLIE